MGSFFKLVNDLLGQRGRTKAQLAAYVQVSPPAIYNWERSLPSRGNLRRVVIFFDRDWGERSKQIVEAYAGDKGWDDWSAFWRDLRSDAFQASGADQLGSEIVGLASEEEGESGRAPIAVGSDAGVRASIDRLPPLAPGSAFHLVVVSGASSSGKDALVDAVKERIGFIGTLDKYTTRDARSFELEYSHTISEVEFQAKLASGEAVFAYEKRGDRYAFDMDRLSDAVRQGQRICAVFTDLDLVPLVIDEMNRRRYAASAFWIDVPVPHLERRTRHRNFDHSERAKRVRSIHQDAEATERRASFRAEYRFVANGDDRAFEDALDEISETILSIVART